jgi:hypothetical protein
MSVARSVHTATLLDDGRVLIAGGNALGLPDGSNVPFATAELYDPSTGSFTVTAGDMTTPRTWHTATRLANGRVLVVGGDAGGLGQELSSAEIFDPMSGTFSQTVGGLLFGRSFHTASLLASGRVLIAGGTLSIGGNNTSSAELYDPLTDQFVGVFAMSSPRSLHSAVSLPTGKVLVVGGAAVYGDVALSSAELFADPGVPRLTALTGANIWLGLKNSDDVGTNFDLHVDTLRNGVVIASGELLGVPGGSSGFNNAVLRGVALALPAPIPLVPGDTLALRVSVRVAATGHRSGTARLWFNDASANSNVGATVGSQAGPLYLVTASSTALILQKTLGSGPRRFVDVFVDRATGGNPFKPLGTWSIVWQ